MGDPFARPPPSSGRGQLPTDIDLCSCVFLAMPDPRLRTRMRTGGRSGAGCSQSARPPVAAGIVLTRGRLTLRSVPKCPVLEHLAVQRVPPPLLPKDTPAAELARRAQPRRRRPLTRPHNPPLRPVRGKPSHPTIPVALPTSSHSGSISPYITPSPIRLHAKSLSRSLSLKTRTPPSNPASSHLLDSHADNCHFGNRIRRFKKSILPPLNH